MEDRERKGGESEKGREKQYLVQISIRMPRVCGLFGHILIM